MPDSLDRADRFFTNVERIVRERAAGLSADSRKFFSTTSAQIEAIASNLDGLVGDEGTLSKFAEEAHAIDAADLPASGRATREAMDQASLAARTCGARCPRCASRSGSCASSRASAGTAGVGGPRHPAGRSEAEMIRRSRYGLVVLAWPACGAAVFGLNARRPFPSA